MKSTSKRKPTSADKISIKGTGEGLVVTIGEGEWCELMHGLTRNLKEQAAFFSGAQTILDASSREMTTEEIRQLVELFSASRMEIREIRTTSPQTAEAAAALEIPRRLETNRHLTSPSLSHSPPEGRTALFVRGAIRSGRKVQYSGHIIIVGDVSPGAEIVADGDIIVWGKLEGAVHAGAQGDNSATVCALLHAASQLRIGGQTARSQEAEDRNPAIPEVARVDGQRIIVEAWDAASTR